MKTIVITGAGSGIGLATAKKFLNNGWQVIGAFHKQEVPIDHENLVTLKLDLSNSQSIVETANKITGMAYKIDALVNNAGMFLDAYEKTADMQKIRNTFDVNLFGTIDFTERLIGALKGEGHIVNIDSLYGSFSFPIDDENGVGYRMSKAALNMYTRILAYRLRESGIIVSSLDPGWVNTDMGNILSTNSDKPDREPEQVAEDIFTLIQNITESGYFWRFGEKQEW